MSSTSDNSHGSSSSSRHTKGDTKGDLKEVGVGAALVELFGVLLAPCKPMLLLRYVLVLAVITLAISSSSSSSCFCVIPGGSF